VRSCRKRSSLACSGVRQVADLVEHQRAAVGGLDLAGRGLGGAGEGALLVAEELAFQQVLGDGGAVDGDEALPLRLEAWCSPCASTSLPVPLSPSSSTVASLLATFSMVRQTRSISGSRVIRPGQRVGLLQRLQAAVLGLQLGQPVGALDGQRQQSGSKGLARKS
jgi:hypothetical protein